ncbi:NAD(P)H-dependent oxidoreductase [Vagococcus vulneris]|uniref:Flavodoxin-like fold domain-containing protein n=1 Tax=Vagococcus vulneris TaxID=1977869 RepID=A0A429ZWJ3_9ENTE|nr:NAD(P)H-dependent oxidoreductase [Vagococcus vulneris]RST98133.1 hypothetical protein CBF37_08855 [Vagococcus vulneris]
MKTTIIIDHPWKGSYNHAILNSLKKKLEKNNSDYNVIDLCKDNFNPMMQIEELEHYQSGEIFDPLVKEYVNIIRKTDQVIFIFPIWWYSSPAGLKGFFDKVFLNKVAFYDDGDGVKPLLNIKKTMIFTTSEQSAEGIYEHGNDCFRNQIKTTLSDVGFQDIEWMHLGSVSSITNEERVDFLNLAAEKTTLRI